MRFRRVALAGLAATGMAAWGLISPVAASASSVHAASGITLSTEWATTLNDAGNPVALSSPIVSPLADAADPAVVVGDRAGHLWAYYLDEKSAVPVLGWPVNTGIPIDSTPSVSGSDIYIGLGNTSTAGKAGGYESISYNGRVNWFKQVAVLPTGGGGTAPVQAGLAVGDLQGQTDVMAPNLGQEQYALNAASGATLGGWPFFAADSTYSTPALADLYANGATDIVEGGDSTAGNAEGKQYTNGGHIRVLSGSGALLCDYDTNQTVDSSPAVGQFLAGDQTGIVTGTGTFWTGASQTDSVLAVTSHCGAAWSAKLNGSTTGSPSLVDALGNGQLQVAEGTQSSGSTGNVYLLNGANGQTIWESPDLGAIFGGVASIDLGGGYQDLVVASTTGLHILDGKTGQVVASALAGYAFQNTPLVTDEGGNVAITVAGYNSANTGVIIHLTVGGVPGGVGNRVNESGSWPMFHHDPQLTGDAGTPGPPPCVAPRSPDGYDMAASDGGLFTYGNLPFCGSTGGIPLVKPVVGMVNTPNAGGYWLVASDGGVFSFGNAKFYGSTGGVPLRQPIVAMAADPATGGYWLVAADGGVFAFNAPFLGSTGGVHLKEPIVGMAADPDGLGYWLVAADGGVFSYGTAKFYGSTGGIRLTKPVVGMAATRTGNGYWMVASDGGIFSYGDAMFHGSTGGIALRQPVVGMSPTSDDNGYWLAASDGGIFAFGDAPFFGSTGGVHLVKPVVTISGF